MTEEQTPVTQSPEALSAPRTRWRAGLPAREARPGRARPDVPDVGEAPPVDPAALALAHRIVDLAADKKAADIVLLDIHALTSVADYLVICSGGSERQLGAIAGGIIEALKDEDLLPIGREGGPSAHWALIDYGSVVAHVMAPPERDYYQLEQLWSDAPLLLHVQ
jgi:ribosome-associated protein